MIVGTAGHIDHGKTTLIQRLTGVHTSRLAEEKRRGITIELGYAWFDTPSGQRISFVDVPGHEKFVRTMVAGATGIDVALLLVAADDGVMPQTREHFAILQWLGITDGIVVITKADRADAERVSTLRRDIANLLDDTAWATVPVVLTSTTAGQGIAELQATLAERATRIAATHGDHVGFRLNLDRVFSLDGVGTVVAGSVRAGSVRVGDTVCLAQRPDEHFRVRSLSRHHDAVAESRSGERSAIGVHGLDRARVERGDALCDPRIAVSTSRVDVLLRAGATDGAIPRSGSRVHLHCGTQDTMATLVLLGEPEDESSSRLGQLVLQSAIAAWTGDRFVLRDAGATRTIAGGLVLDPYPPARYRQTRERLAFLRAVAAGDEAQPIQTLLASSPNGLDVAQLRRARGWTDWPDGAATWQRADALVDTAHEFAIARRWISEHAQVAANIVNAFHTSKPDEPGVESARLRRMVAPRLPASLWPLVLAQAAERHGLSVAHGFVAAQAHRQLLDARDRHIVERALPRLLAGGNDPPWVRTLAQELAVPEEQMRAALSRLAKMGGAHQIVKDLFYHPDVVAQLATLVRAHVDAQQRIVAREFRDLTGLGRHRAIQILEFFDRVGLLRRHGDAHVLRSDSGAFLRVPTMTASADAQPDSLTV